MARKRGPGRMMATFAEIAVAARYHTQNAEPVLNTDCTNSFINAVNTADLAEAMERFERNTAEALSRISPQWRPQVSVDQWLEQLRK